VWRRISGKKSDRILLLGLDNAGKTTLLNSLMGKETNKTVPTIGFNVEVVKKPPFELVVWDVGGQDKLRSYWRHYYHGTSGIVFLVDSSDEERLTTVKKEIFGILKEEELESAAILILGNKSDMANSLNSSDINSRLGLDEGLKNRKWTILPCSAIKSEGVNEGIDWLLKNMTHI